MNKYCNLLISSLPEDVCTIIVCQRIKGQKRYEIIDNVHVYRTYTFGGRAIRQIIANLLSFFIGLRIHKIHNIDIIHGHQQPGIVIGHFLGKIPKKPVVGTPYSFTTTDMNFINNMICKYLESTYYKKLNRIVFESEENRQKAYQLRKLVFPNSIVIRTGIEMPSKNQSRDQGNALNILYLGRLVKIKATENLILSFTYLEAAILNKIHLNIAGEGELFDELTSIIASKSLEPYITMHGYVENSAEMYRNNDVFILPSYQEGLSISLLEAMSNGLACIVNNFGVPFPKGTVFEMTDNNPQTIASALTEVVSNTTLYEELKHKALKEINDNFSLQKFAEKYYTLYKELTIS